MGVLSQFNNTTNHETSSHLIHETVKRSYEFNINGYSIAKGMGVGKSMTSGKFRVAGYDWVIVFYPDGDVEASKEYLSLFLKLVNPDGNDVKALFEFKLLDQSGEGNHRLSAGGAPKSPSTFNAASCSGGYNKYMKRLDFETSSYLSKDDCFSIHCTIEVVVKTIESDITIQVDNEFFTANKSILAARSLTFRALFSGLGNPDMETVVINSDRETVVIEKFDPFAFKAMLLFLDSDELPQIHELPETHPRCTSITLMQHLLAAAERFVLDRLKILCLAKLCEEITANTVATILSLAEQHQCRTLKTFCLNFATKPENLGEIMKSDGYADLEKSHPSLLKELLRTSLAVDNK